MANTRAQDESETIDYLRQVPLLLQAALLAVLSLAVVTRRARRQLRRLRQLADAIAAASRSSHTARALEEAVLETVAQAGLVYLLDRPQGMFTLKGTYGPKDGVRRQVQWGEEGWPALTLGETACCESWPAGLLGLCEIANRRRRDGGVHLAVVRQPAARRTGDYLPSWRAVGDDVAALIAGIGEHPGAVVENLEMQDALRARAVTLDEMVGELRRRDEAQRQLIEETAHGIRSPLSSGRTCLQLALQDGELALPPVSPKLGPVNGTLTVTNRARYLVHQLNTLRSKAAAPTSV